MAPTIGLIGDVMLAGRVGEALLRDPAGVWSEELRALARSCELVICNLECCISARGAPTNVYPDKTIVFRAPPRAVGCLQGIGVGAVSVANNHSLDFGPQAFGDTLAHLADTGVAVAGGGPDEAGARRGIVVEAGGSRFGLIAFTDHPPGYAAWANAPGTAFADLRQGCPRWLTEELRALRDRCDWLIAAPHWGWNWTTKPARWQRRAASELQAAGVDLLAGHSSHAFHGVGWGVRGPLLYDLGDALFDSAVDPELRNDLGLMALWRPGQALELVGLRIEDCRTGLAAGADAEWIAARLQAACGSLGTGVKRTGEGRFRVIH